MIDTCIVLAKEPTPGRVKTRLTPDLSPEQAAVLAAAALSDTLAAIEKTPARRRLLAFDGAAEQWTPRGWRRATQPAGGLDVRLAAAFESAGVGSAVLVGMDTPQLHAAQLAAFDPERFDACVGPARDGGYWAIGLRDIAVASAALVGVPMSVPETCAAQLRRLHELGLRVQLLDQLTDVDTVADADEVAAIAPRTAFAQALADMRRVDVRDAS